MILNLLNTMLITLGTGASVLNMPKKPTPPQNRLISNFDLTLSTSAKQDSRINLGNNKYQYNITQKLSGNNTGLLVKGNTIVENSYAYLMTGGTYINHIAIEKADVDRTQRDTSRTATIYQITTYENTQNVETNYTIYTLVGINRPSDPNNIINKIKYKTITYQTQEDWSGYVDRNDYMGYNYIDTLQQEIESPNNGYRYSKLEQITEAENISSNNDTTATIETNITLTKGTTTYVIQINEPIVETKNGYTNPEGTIGIVQTQQFIAENFFYLPNMNYHISGQIIIAEGTQEIVDIPGLMFQVLTMPFTFISAAFNLTLFPGTPYQINISNLFMAIIAVMAFIFIIKLLIGMKGGN